MDFNLALRKTSLWAPDEDNLVNKKQNMKNGQKQTAYVCDHAKILSNAISIGISKSEKC